MTSLELQQRDPTRDREPGDLVRVALDQQVQLNSRAGRGAATRRRSYDSALGPPPAA